MSKTINLLNEGCEKIRFPNARAFKVSADVDDRASPKDFANFNLHVVN